MPKQSELDCFTNLGCANGSVSFNNSRKILSSVNINKNNNSANLVYTIKRLVQGLGGRKIRQGCYATLTSLLEGLPDGLIDYGIFSGIMSKVLNSSSHTLKKEVGDIAFGELLSYSALIETDFLHKETDEVRQRIASNLFKIALSKSYLHYPAFLCLTELCSKYEVDYNTEEFKAHMIKINEHTLDKLYFFVHVTTYTQLESARNLLCEATPAITINKNIRQIASLLLKNCSVNSMEHPFFDLYFRQLGKNTKKLKRFWKTISDPSVLETRKKTVVILNIILHILNNNKNKSLVEEIISNKPILSILNENYRNCNLVKNIFNKVVEILQYTNDDDVGTCVRVIRNVLIDCECLAFDKAAGPKICIPLIVNLNFHSIRLLSDSFKEILLGKTSKQNGERWTAKEKLNAFSYYTRLIKHKSAHNETEWLHQEILSFYDMALYSPDISMELTKFMGVSFFNYIGNIYSNISDHKILLKKLVHHMKEKLTSGCPPKFKFDDEDFNEWLTFIIWSLEVTSETNNIKEILEVLIFYMLLSSFRDPKWSFCVLNDIKAVYIKCDQQSKVDATHWSCCLVDIYLNMLSKPYSGNRALVGALFKHTLDYLNVFSYKPLLFALDIDFKFSQRLPTPHTSKLLIDPRSIHDTNSDSPVSSNRKSDDVDDISNGEAEIQLLYANEKTFKSHDVKIMETVFRLVTNDETSNQEDEENESSSSEEGGEENERSSSVEDGVDSECDEGDRAIRSCISGISQGDDQSVGVIKQSDQDITQFSDHGNDDNHDDEVSINESEIDEKDMANLNMIAQEVIKRNRLLSKKKQIRETKLSHFRIRLLDLIEICCKKSNNIPLRCWLIIIRRLVTFLKFSSKHQNETAFYKKIESCIKKLNGLSLNYISQIKIPEKVYIKLLVSWLLKEASSATVKSNRDNFMDLIIFLVKVCNCFGNLLEDILSDFLNLFFTERHQVPFNFVLSLCEANHQGMESTARIAIIYTFSPVIKLQRRILGLQILRKYFSNNTCEDKTIYEIFQSHVIQLKTDESFGSIKRESFKKYFHGLCSLMRLFKQKQKTNLFTSWNLSIKVLIDVSLKYNNKHFEKTLYDLYDKELEMPEVTNDIETNVVQEVVPLNLEEIKSHKRKMRSNDYKKKSKRLRLEAINMDGVDTNFNHLQSIINDFSD